MFAVAHLLDPLRTRAQYAAGVAANAEHELQSSFSWTIRKDAMATRTSFVTKPRGFMFGRQVFTQKGYRGHCSPGKGVVQVPRENVPDFFESSYVATLESAMQKIQKKLKQSQVTKKRKADEDAQKAQADSTAAASSSAQADASSCTVALVPLPKTPPKRALATSSGQPDAPRRGGDQSWSWSRDRYTVATCLNGFNQA